MIKFFDGGMGSMLNLAAGELPEKLNISDPERVLRSMMLMQKQVRSLLLQTPLAQIHLNMIMLMNL